VAVGASVGVKVGSGVRVMVGVKVGKPPPSALADGGVMITIANTNARPIRMKVQVLLSNSLCFVCISVPFLSKDSNNSFQDSFGNL
jgi:hypothetical protein